MSGRTSAALLHRGSADVRSQALLNLLGNLSELEQSLHEATLPEFSSVLRQKPVLLIQPNLFEEDDLLLRQEKEGRQGTQFRARSLTPTAMRHAKPRFALRHPGMLKHPTWRVSRPIRRQSTRADSHITIPRWPGTSPSHLHPSTKHLSKILQRTGSLDKYKPEIVHQSIKIKAVKDDLHACEIRNAKQEIYTQKLQRTLEEVQTKARRYEWRQRARDIMEGKKRWTGVLYYMNTVRWWHDKFVRRRVMSIQALHARSQAVLKFLLVMTISVGKIAAKVKEMRRKKAYQELKRLIPYVRRWKARWLRARREHITEFIEDSLCKNTIYKLIVTWKTKVMWAQRAVKHWLQRRKAQKILQLLMWCRVERALRTVKQLDTPPLAVKMMLITELMRSRMKDYVEKVGKWNKTCREIADSYAERRLETLLEEQMSVMRLPQKPRLPVIFTRDEVFFLMSQAEKKKSRWLRLAKGSRHSPYRLSDDL